MAKQIGERTAGQPARAKPKRQYLREAAAAAEAAGEILTQRYGQQPWIAQVQDAVRNAVQNGIELLSGTAVSVNAHPHDGYRFPARSKEELLATQHLVPGVNRADLPPDDDEPAAPPRNVSPPAKGKPQGWIV